MIKNWRKEWQDDLPFYLVQLMPYNESANVADWATIRSEQEKAAKVIPNVYMVTLVNTGEAYEIHPKNKKTVAYSLANAVKNIQFGENVEYSGPILSGCKKIPQGIELEFSHAKELTLKGDRLLDLQLINNENALIPFKAVIENDRLKLFYNTTEVVSKITLGYCNAPEHNLYNDSGYLASPFCIENPFS
jgi:sialate O-acetylesterase